MKDSCYIDLKAIFMGVSDFITRKQYKNGQFLLNVALEYILQTMNIYVKKITESGQEFFKLVQWIKQQIELQH